MNIDKTPKMHKFKMSAKKMTAKTIFRSVSNETEPASKSTGSYSWCTYEVSGCTLALSAFC